MRAKWWPRPPICWNFPLLLRNYMQELIFYILQGALFSCSSYAPTTAFYRKWVVENCLPDCSKSEPLISLNQHGNNYTIPWQNIMEPKFPSFPTLQHTACDVLTTKVLISWLFLHDLPTCLVACMVAPKIHHQGSNQWVVEIDSIFKIWSFSKGGSKLQSTELQKKTIHSEVINFKM